MVITENILLIPCLRLIAFSLVFPLVCMRLSFSILTIFSPGLHYLFFPPAFLYVSEFTTTNYLCTHDPLLHPIGPSAALFNTLLFLPALTIFRSVHLPSLLLPAE